MVEYAQTAKFSEFVVEVETVDGSGVYTRMCGLTTRGTTRQANMNTNNVPPCDDENAPSQVEKSVESLEQTISGSGSWARQSHDFMLRWWRSGLTKNVRIQHARALPGEIEYESGPAYLTTLTNEGERGNKVTAEIAIEFDGLPVATEAA
jgi:hypothetical protein